MLVSIGTYEICDGSLSGGVAVGNGRLQLDRVFDIVVPIAELNPELFDRVCRKSTFTFAVQRIFSDAGTAELFVMDLDSDVPSIGTVTITATDGSTRIIPNGFVLNHQSQLNGATATITYTIVGGQPAMAPP